MLHEQYAFVVAKRYTKAPAPLLVRPVGYRFGCGKRPPSAPWPWRALASAARAGGAESARRRGRLGKPCANLEEAHKRPQDCPQDGPRHYQDGPRRLQDGSKTALIEIRRPSGPQEAPKRPPRGPHEVPKRPQDGLQDGPKTLTMVMLSELAHGIHSSGAPMTPGSAGIRSRGLYRNSVSHVLRPNGLAGVCVCVSRNPDAPQLGHSVACTRACARARAHVRARVCAPS